MSYQAHDTAIIDAGAEVGENTRIWHFSHVCSGAIIGDNCSIGQNVFVSGNARVGNNVKIQNNVSVYDNVVLEDDVFCGPSCVFTNVVNPRSHISRKHQYSDTIIGQGVTLGANCTVVCGHSIGPYAFVAAGAVVTKDIPPFALVAGVPASQIGWMSRAGLRLDLPLIGEGEALCPETKRAYNLRGNTLRPAD
jgi:UDP-2-acetamido-3-amino-2,3-dideoxy-glucuronate N-acetyltransferase